jgi:hypothetical protein
MASERDLHSRLRRSKWITQHIIFPVLKQHLDYLGDCYHASPDQDMNDKVDVVCRNLQYPDAMIKVGVRCQDAKFAHLCTSTFRNTEICHYLNPNKPLPDLAVHAYITDDNTLVSMAIIKCIHLREIIDWKKYLWKDAEGERNRFKAIPWRDYREFEVIIPAPLFE